jgi:NDP-sugar pyrophosphorylase family protein
MASVASRPFLEYVLARMSVDGIKDVVLCVGYSRSHVHSHFNKGTKWGLELRYSEEKELLGNAGAVKRAARLIDATAPFVFNGNSFLDLDVRAMWDFHHSRRALATLALVSLTRPNGYTRISTDDRGAITSFNNDSSINANNPNHLVNAGTYLLSRQCIDLIPEGRPASIEKDIFPPLVGSGLYGFVTGGYFIDIGLPDDLARAQHELPMRWKL